MTKVVLAEQNDTARLKRQLDELGRKRQALEQEAEKRTAQAIMAKMEDIRLTEHVATNLTTEYDNVKKRYDQFQDGIYLKSVFDTAANA